MAAKGYQRKITPNKSNIEQTDTAYSTEEAHSKKHEEIHRKCNSKHTTSEY